METYLWHSLTVSVSLDSLSQHWICRCGKRRVGLLVIRSRLMSLLIWLRSWVCSLFPPRQSCMYTDQHWQVNSGTKFTKTYDTVEKLKSFEVTELPDHKDLYTTFPKPVFQRFMAIFELWTTDGTSTFETKSSLNEKFRGIETMTVRRMLEDVWIGKGWSAFEPFGVRTLSSKLVTVATIDEDMNKSGIFKAGE